ncbi:aarF domain containing kinase 1 isoform 2-T2 [Cochliomyia hominivorax]
MSRKNKSRSDKKQKRKVRRKTKRYLNRMKMLEAVSKAAGGSCSSNVILNNDGTKVNNSQKNQIDERPSTSQKAKKQFSPKKNNKRSPWRNSSGKVNKFKKIRDDQRKLVRRSVYFVKDNQTNKILTPRKVSPMKKLKKRLINQNNSRKKKNHVIKGKSKDEREEGEICSDIDESLGNNETDTIQNKNNKQYESDDDDCVVIEPTLDEITVDDCDDKDVDNKNNDKDDVGSASDVSTHYESIMDSFAQRISSTPCQLNKPSYASVLKNSKNEEKNNYEENLPFYVDVGRGSIYESINSTDTFDDYNKLSTLKEKSPTTQRTVRLKETTEAQIIDLDSSCYDKTNSTLKKKSLNLTEIDDKDDDDDGDDDSVIFISEENGNDFIPINDPKLPAQASKTRDVSPTRPVNRLRTNILFTQSETKKLNEYNTNTYNPGGKEGLTSGKRMVIIDGSNVAFKHGLDQVFSVKGLKIAIEYFEKMGHEVKAVIPQFRMNRNKSTDTDELLRLHKAGKIVQTPCKNLPGLTSISYDDRFVLQLAFELDAAIVSNDNYRDLLHENPAFKKIIENRVIGYTWCNDIFILPKDPYGKWGPTLQQILNRS